jgi:hypothetical protein
MGDTKNTYEILVGKYEGKLPFGRTRRRCEDNVRLDVKETLWESVD